MENIEVSLSFNTIFRVGISHQYFGNEDANIFIWQPSPETKKMLTKMGLLLRIQQDNWAILSSSDKEEPLIHMLNEEESLTLSFKLFTNNPYFFHFTDLSLENKNKVLYLSNQHQEILHPKDKVNNQDWLSIHPRLFSLAGLTKNAEVSLQNNLKKTVFSTVAQSDGTCTFNLAEMPEGKYTLWVNKQLKETFLLVNSSLNPRLLAWIDIEINPAFRQSLIKALNTQQDLPTQTYQIFFGARATYWRYYLVSKYLENLKTINIETGNKKINFGEAKTVKLANGTEAICFESNQALLLQKNPSLNFQLYRQKDNKGNQINLHLRSLPSPGIETLKPASREPEAKIFSEVLIYL